VVGLVGRLPEKRNGHFSMDTLERHPSHTSETTDFNFSTTEAGLQNQPPPRGSFFLTGLPLAAGWGIT
jgi:hypothetical protein